MGRVMAGTATPTAASELPALLGGVLLKNSLIVWPGWRPVYYRFTVCMLCKGSHLRENLLNGFVRNASTEGLLNQTAP